MRGLAWVGVFLALGCQRSTPAISTSAAPQLHSSGAHSPRDVITSPGTDPLGATAADQELVTVGASSLIRAPLGAGLNNQISRGSFSGVTPPNAPYAAALYDGYIYAFGGYDSSSNNYSQQVVSMPLANPTAWSDANTTATLFGIRQNEAGVICDGYIYVLGGYGPNGCISDVSFAPLLGGGQVGAWQPTTPLPDTAQYTTAVAYRGYLYIIGGQDQNGTSQPVLQAPINGDGTLGAWTTVGSTALVRYYAGVAAFDGFLYVTGGYDLSNSTINTVSYIPVDSQGASGDWTASVAWPNPLGPTVSAVVGGYLYNLNYGGSDSFNVAQLLPNGSLGPWVTSHNLESIFDNNALFADSNNLYALGNNATNLFQMPVSFSVNAQNSISATTSPTTTLQYAAAVGYRGWMYVIGGIDQSSHLATTVIQEAQMFPNGTLGAWQQDPVSLPSARQSHVAAIHNGYLYVASGCSDVGCTSPLHDVMRTPVNVASGGLINGWETLSGSDLGTGRYQAASTTWGDDWYVLGGTNNSDQSVTTIQVATFEPDGGLSAWASGGSLPGSGLSNFPVIAAQGQVYLATGSSSTPIQAAPVLPSGALSSFATLSSATVTSSFSGLATWNGNLLALNGGSLDIAPIAANGSLGTFNQQNVLGASIAAPMINNGNLFIFDLGQGATNSGSTPLSQDGLPLSQQEIGAIAGQARSGHGMAFANGVAYLAGGQVAAGAASDGGVVETYLSDVQYVALNSSAVLPGLVGWAQTSSLPNARAGLGFVQTGGWLYAVGGIGSSGYSAEVDAAPINPDGTVGTFTPVSSFPGPRAFAWVGVYRGNLYVMGGTNGTDLADVVLAPITGGGTLGAWTTSAVSLPAGRSHLMGGAYAGYLYAFGGQHGAMVLDSVLVAPLGATGQPTAWKSSAAMSDARRDALGFALQGRLYAVGGSNGNIDFADIVVAPITGSAGQLASWYDTGSALTATLSGLAGALTDANYLVWSGGRSAGVDQSDSESFGFSLTDARGSYSQLIDLGAPSVISDMSLGGTATLPGSLSLFYAAAPENQSDGGPPAFGAEVAVGTVTPSATIPVAAANVRYVRMRAVLDDSDEVVVGPAVGSPGADSLVRNLTSLSVTAFSSNIAQIAFAPASGQSVPAGSCSTAIAVEAEDATGAAAAAPSGAGLVVSLSGTTFYAGTGCSGSPVTSVTIPAGASSATFSFEASSPAASLQITAQVEGLPAISQDEVITTSVTTSTSASSSATASTNGSVASSSSGTTATSSSASTSTSTSTSSGSITTSASSSGTVSSSSSGSVASAGSSSGGAMGTSSGAACTTSIVQDANLSAVVGTDYLYSPLGAIDVTGNAPAGITYSACGPATSVPGFVVFPSTGVVTWVPSAASTVPLCVEITYGGSCVSTYSFSVTVVSSSSAQAPTAAISANPLSIQVGEAVSFDGGGSQPGTGATIVDYLWDFGDSSSVDPTLLNQSAASHTYQQPGGYVARLTVINSLGQQATSPGVPISVGDAQCENPPAVLIVAPQLTGNVGFSETFSVQGTSGLTYLWDFGDGTESSSASPTHTFSTAGLYHIRLTGIDPSTGCTAQDAVQVSVSNGSQEPPNCQFIAEPGSGSLDASGQLAVTFRAICFESPSAGSNTAPTLTYAWQFDDDGTTSAQATVVHTYTQAGSFSPKITVTDPAGLTNSDTLAETVLNSSGVAAPQILSSPGTSAACNQTYAYNSLDGNKLLVRAPGAVTYTVGKMVGGSVTGAPAGLTVSTQGVVTWTPTPAEAGNQSIVLVATDPGGAAVQQFTVDVACSASGTDGGTCADGGSTCSAPAKGCGCTSGDFGFGGLLVLLAWARHDRRRWAR